MSRTARSRLWKIKQNGSISFGAVLAAGFFVFKMTNDELLKVFTVRFLGGGEGWGGGLSFNHEALFDNIGWSSVKSPLSFSMEDLHLANGKLVLAGASFVVGVERCELSAWKRTSDSGMREGILFIDTVMQGANPEIPKPKPKVGVQVVQLKGKWWVDS